MQVAFFFLAAVGIFDQVMSLSPTQHSDVANMALRGTHQVNDATLPARLQKLGSSVRQMAKESHHPVRFEVVLDRSKGQSNGVATAWLKGRGGTHCITSIMRNGLVAAWNKAHPDNTIKKDDCIVEVNGVRDNADAVLKELKEKKLLRVKIQRGGMLVPLDSGELPAHDDLASKALSKHGPAPKVLSKEVTDKATVNPMAVSKPQVSKDKEAVPKAVNTTKAVQATMNTSRAISSMNKTNGVNTSLGVSKANQSNVSQVVDAALRAAARADAISKEMSDTWTRFPPEYQVANAGCFNHTGRKCDANHKCGESAHCSKGWCVCAEGGCADSRGTCRAKSNEWLAMDLRIAPSEDPHNFMAMATDERSGPFLMSGWPADGNAEALWDFLVQPDNVSVLIATKWGRDHWHGRFIDLNESSFLFQPVQRQPYDALQATWNLIVLPRSRLAFRHARTGLYLMWNQKEGSLSTCSSPDCPSLSADFDIWPRIENDQEPCDGCETPYYKPAGGAGQIGHYPWFINPKHGWGTRSTPQGDRAPKDPWYMKEH